MWGGPLLTIISLPPAKQKQQTGRTGKQEEGEDRVKGITSITTRSSIIVGGVKSGKKITMILNAEAHMGWEFWDTYREEVTCYLCNMCTQAP